MHTKSELSALLRAHGLRLNKRLGQHYLIDPHMCRKLVRSCRLTKANAVVEIGSGLGALTDLLAADAKRVIAIEVDRAICEALKQRMAALPNVEVRHQDVQRFDWAAHAGHVAVGALPYCLTSPILVALCDHAGEISRAWFGVQREVAQRLAARPGTKAYGRLTVLVQYHFDVRVMMPIPRGAFFPQPEVDSSWIELRARPKGFVPVKDEAMLFELVRAAFSQRRKTLVNCLQQLKAPRLSREQAVAVLADAGLPERVRGEALSIAQFARLADLLSQR